MDEVRKLDSGVEILVTLKDSDDVAIDVSAASAISFRFSKPDGTVATASGSFKTDGSDGKVYYLTDSDDLDQTGIWRYQVWVTLSGGVLHSEKGSFRVDDIIS